jgi:hypothetical protein
MKVYRLVLMVVDHDQIGHDEMRTILENQKYPNHCMYPTVTEIDYREIGEWSDDHPLNRTATSDATFRALFADPKEEA